MSENPLEILEQVRSRLDDWNIHPEKISLASQSENIVYRVKADDGKHFAFRVHRPGYHTLQELNSEHAWTAALGAHGFSLPTALPAKSGEYYVPVEVNGGTRYVGLIEWLPGKSLESLERDGEAALTQTVLTKLGSIMARLHIHSSGWQPPDGYTRHRLDIDGFFGDEPFWGRYWDSPFLAASERELLLTTQNSIVASLERLGTASNVFGMIHADLHHGNVLVEDSELFLIDFDDSGFGWYLYDIAVALFEYDQRSDFQQLRESFLEAYTEIRPLSDEHLALLPMFLHVRARAIIGWATARPELENTERLQALVSLTCEAARDFE